MARQKESPLTLAEVRRFWKLTTFSKDERVKRFDVVQREVLALVGHRRYPGIRRMQSVDLGVVRAALAGHIPTPVHVGESPKVDLSAPCSCCGNPLSAKPKGIARQGRHR